MSLAEQMSFPLKIWRTDWLKLKSSSPKVNRHRNPEHRPQGVSDRARTQTRPIRINCGLSRFASFLYLFQWKSIGFIIIPSLNTLKANEENIVCCMNEII